MNFTSKMNLGLQFCCSAKMRWAQRYWPLDALCCVRKETGMNMRLIPVAALALLALSACENKPTEVSSIEPDPMASVLANKAPVELPPSIRADVTFRCKDNSLAFVTFFNGDKQALVKATKEATPVKLTAEAAGEPYKADGYLMTGNEKAVTLTQPGKPAQVCDH